MQKRPLPPTPLPQPEELAELLRQSLLGLAPSDPLAHFLDRLEGRK